MVTRHALILFFGLITMVSSAVLIDTKGYSSQNYSWSSPCGADYSAICPFFNGECGVRVLDNVFDMDDISHLHNIAKKGMSARADLGGPTILDINTGFLRDTNGMQNLFMEDSDIFSSEDFEHYGNIVRRLKHVVEVSFQAQLHFTAPTFITRLDGRPSWEPNEIHDEYWHMHADMNNTGHYHFSGLLYMSTYQADFGGGRLLFYSGGEEQSDLEASHIVEPIAGRVAIFSSGPENPHRVERLDWGQRFVLAFWFTCNEAKEFQIFLDGKAHVAFSKRIKTTLETRKKNGGEL